MPGYIIHLTEAELIYQALIKRKLLQCLDIDSWKRQFIYGNLLPDAVPKEHKSRSHFWSQKDEGNFIRVPDLSFFLSKYQVSLSNPAICGYYTHLYLDHAFWKRFFPECVKIDGQNAATGLECSCFVYKSNKRLTIKQLFSEKYIYGDYTKLNQYFINKYDLTVDCMDISRCVNPVREVDLYDMAMLYRSMDKYILTGRKNVEETKVFFKEKLEAFLEDCSECFIQQLL